MASEMQANPEHEPHLRIKRYLRASLHRAAGKPFYLIEDPIGVRFFRIGVEEWEFVSRLDGSLTMGEVLQAVYASTGDSYDDGMTPQSAEAMCRWLITNGLIEPSSLPPEMRQLGESSVPAAVNPFFIKVPLVHPDRWFDRLLPMAGFLLSRYVFVLWAFVMVLGGFSLATNFGKFASSAAAYLSPTTWWSLWIVWICLKLVHEVFHGLVCKRYGGNLGAAGLMLILFSPCAFVDVTSSWRFRSKWQRVFTSAAGMYAELFVAAIAAIVWAHTDSSWVTFLCHNIVLTASLTTVLFNANPLMRFDGYYIMADLLDFQNLYSAGRQFTVGKLRQLFLGEPPPKLEQSGWRRAFVAVYGVLSMGWRLMISAGMVLAAAVLFHGAGIALAIFGFMCWFALPAWRFGIFMLFSSDPTPPPRRRFALAMACTVLTLAAVLLTPWPGGVVAPAIVQYAPLETIRSATDGFVDEVLVKSGDRVQIGDIVLRLRNNQLLADWHATRLAAKATLISARGLQSEGEVAGYQAEMEKYRALSEKQSGLLERVESLEVRATQDGEVLNYRLQDLRGKYVELGAPLVQIGDETRKEIAVAIPEEFSDSFLDKVGQQPRLRVGGKPIRSTSLILTKVEPSATVRLRYAPLGGNNGGPLPVQPVSPNETTEGKSNYRLVAPRIHGVVSLDSRTSAELRAGQLAEVRFWHVDESIGRRLQRSILRWIRGKMSLS